MVEYEELKAKVHNLIEEDPFGKGEDDFENLTQIQILIDAFLLELEDNGT